MSRTPFGDRPIFLVGFMGSGKSSVGRALASELRREFVDTDAAVVERDGREIDTIFKESGEGRFRALEWECLQSLDGTRNAVVATGGGLFVGAIQRRWIKDRGPSVWLDVPLEECRRRVGQGRGRPLWDTADPLMLRATFEKRRAVYALADLRIRAPASGSEVVAGEIVSRLGHVFR